MLIGVITQGVFFTALGLYAVFFTKLPNWARIAVGVCFLVPFVFTAFIAIYGSRDNVTFEEDVVIVLGARVSGERVSGTLARRLDTALYILNQNPNAYVVVCGGLGDRATITEAEAMARYLNDRGISRDRILLEDRSTSTMENLSFARDILNDHFPDDFSAVVVSNDFHMFRAVSTARRLGMEVNHMGSPTARHLFTENYLREMLAIINFWIFG